MSFFVETTDFAAALATRSYAHPTFARHAQLKRSLSEVQDAYDFIVIGGGLSGLTVADRLTEDPSKMVLVVEYGYLADDPCIRLARNNYNTYEACLPYIYNITTAPIPDLNDLVIPVYALGAVVGGGSAVNGQYFPRGSKADYDAWEELGNPGWGWEGIYPYFKKSVTFTPPSPEYVEEYGYTWDEDAYGDGPIQASYAPFQWNVSLRMCDAWKDMDDVNFPEEAASGDAVGVFWIPASQDPVTQTRSYSRTGHYDPVKSRPNYHLLVGHKVESLNITTDLKAGGVVISERGNANNTAEVIANAEVILAAGAAHSPQLLQRSGIGPKEVLEGAGIDTKVDLPGVGQNMQDHPQVYYTCEFQNNILPDANTLGYNETFQAEALAEYNASKTGPLTLALFSNMGAFLSLQTISPEYQAFVSALAAQAPDEFLKPNLSEFIVAGFEAQKEILARHFAAKDAAAYEDQFGGSCAAVTIMQKPLSRGSVNINSTDPSSDPVIDFRTFSNPLDLQMATAFLKYTRKYTNGPALADLQPLESLPGANVTADADLEKYLRNSTFPSSFHISGTASMMPRELGGVVDSELKVYGVDGLRVVDTSIFPLIPAAHMSAPAYAVAEKAADLIKERWK